MFFFLYILSYFTHVHSIEKNGKYEDDDEIEASEDETVNECRQQGDSVPIRWHTSRERCMQDKMKMLEAGPIIESAAK